MTIHTPDDDAGKHIVYGIILAIAVGLSIISANVLAAPATITYTKDRIEEIQREEKIEATEIQIAVVEQVDVQAGTFLYYASYCESRHRQFNEDGSVLRGYVDSRDTGRWQINTYYWGDKAIELGYDIETEYGNYMMAKYILEEAQGEQAWSASAPCMYENFGYIM
jgi:hypothetical protein